jgi:hypothetical protein
MNGMTDQQEEKLADLLELWEDWGFDWSWDEATIVVLTKKMNCPELQPEMRRRVRALRRMEWLGVMISPPK